MRATLIPSSISGYKTSSQVYPYFRSSTSRKALLKNEPIPVKSCWNGIIVFDASPFYGENPLRFRGIDVCICLYPSIDPSPTTSYTDLPLKDTLAAHHLEGSECCLIHSDNPLRAHGIFVNPSVRVSYNATTYSLVNPPYPLPIPFSHPITTTPTNPSDAPARLPWPHPNMLWKGIWLNRVARWMGAPRVWSELSLVKETVEKWKMEGSKLGGAEMRREEIGLECLINEMQVLYQNGWQHV
jgi:hypothetical protein